MEIRTLRGPGYLAPPASGTAESGGAERPPLPGTGEQAPPVAEDVYPGERALLDVVERACGGCHSGAEGDPARDLFSIDGLLGNWLWPRSGESSLLAVWLQYGYGNATPGHSGFELEPGDYRAVVDFIDGMWDGYGCNTGTPRGRDEATLEMLKDIQSRDPADRPFIRYIGITHFSPTTSCLFSAQHAAAVQLLNAVSLGPRIVIPTSFDTIFIHAIDLRDYAWNRPIDFGGEGTPGVTFADGWEALVAAAQPYAQELQGPDADVLKQETGTAVPYVPDHVFVAVASTGDLYHSLVGLGTNVNDTRAALGVTDDGLLRAGMFRTGPTGERVVVRRTQSSDPAQSWWTREWLDSAADPGGLRLNPIDYPQSGQEIMFELPNGLYAFGIADADGTRVAQEPSCTGGVCDPPVAAESSITCRGCHGLGPLILPPDDVSLFADQNPTAYMPTTLANVRAQYRPAELGERLTADNERQLAALQALGSLDQLNLIGMVYYDFYSSPLDAPAAAAELGVTLDELRTAIPAVDDPSGSLAPLLGGGSIDRSLFGARFQALGCAIAGSRNVPAGCP